MKLEEIGFYTLSDHRAKTAWVDTPLSRCELILTSRCNLNCTYCRGLRDCDKGDMPVNKAVDVLHHWCREGLRNVRFSGGEPTLYGGLPYLVDVCRRGGVERIAVSTNGTAPLNVYQELIDAGVNDFSISLDSGCCSTSTKMSGGVNTVLGKASEAIGWLSKRAYVTTGIVFTEDNISEAESVVRYAHDLGVADIRVIPSAQYNQALNALTGLESEILAAHPILRYRVENISRGNFVRGICSDDYHKCPLALDDMAIAGDSHYPCIIYMREMGAAIGKVSKNMRAERLEWFKRHDTHKDPICRRNCLDVCVDYNNRWRDTNRHGDSAE